MGKISFQFDFPASKVIIAFFTAVCIMVFYLNYPAAGSLSAKRGRWDNLASTLSHPDISPERSRLLRKKIQNRRLRALTEIKIVANYWLPLKFDGFPQVAGIILVALAGACLAGSLISAGVEFYWAVLFAWLWAALPGVWQNATQGSWDSWVIGIYALSWSGLNQKCKQADALYWLVKILSGVLAGVLVSFGSEGWILLLGWGFCFPLVYKDREAVLEDSLGFGIVLGMALATALGIHYLIYQPLDASSFFRYLIEPFKSVFFSGNWGWFSAVEKLGAVLPDKLFAYQGWLVGIIPVILLAFTLRHFPLVQDRFWPLITSALGLGAVLILDKEAAPLWPAVLYPWIVLIAIIVSRISQETVSRAFSIFCLLAVILFFGKSIELKRELKIKKYSPLRTLTSRWSKSVTKPRFRGLYEANSFRQVLGFVYSQIEPDSWLLVNDPGVYSICLQRGDQKTAVFPYIGHSRTYLYNKHDLTELDAILYQTKLTPVKLRELLARNIPVYLLTNEADKVKDDAKFLKLKGSLYLQVGYDDFEVYRLTLRKP